MRLILRKYLLNIIAFLSYSIILLSINNNDITLINTRAEMYTSSYSPTSGNTTVDIPAIPATKIKFSMFNEPDLGIKFLYPLGWEPVIKRGSGNSTLIEILFPNMTSSSNSSSLDSGHWHGPATSFIVLSIADSDSSLSNSNVTALNSLTKQNLVLANQTLPNFHLIASNATTFAGNPAHRIVYSFTEPSMLTPSAFQFQSMNVWTIKEDKTYTLSYSQPMEEYRTYLAVVQQMVDSFEITE
jgi:PsbP